MEEKKVLQKFGANIGWKYAIFVAAVMASQVGIQVLVANLLPEWYENNIILFSLLLIIISVDMIGFPLIFLLTRKNEKQLIEKHKMGFGKIVVSVLMCAGIMGAGMLVGNLIHFALTLPFGANAEETNALATLMMNSSPWIRILTVGILAPIFEELIFRKLLIDRAIKYGEFAAIMMSGIMFGLFHGNFQQFFYAAGLGMLFAFIYIRTGKVWYTMLLHMIVNLSSSVVTVLLLGKYMEAATSIDVEALEEISQMSNAAALTEVQTQTVMDSFASMGSVFLFLGWMGFLGVLAIIGFIMLIVKRKSFKLNIAENELPKKVTYKAIFGSWGMIIYIVVCAILFLTTYLPGIIRCFIK